VVQGPRRADPGPDGRQRTDGRTPDGRTPDGRHQTAGQAGPGRRNQVTGHPTVGHRTAGHPTVGHPTVGHPTVGHRTAGHRTAGHRTGRGTGPGGHPMVDKDRSGRYGGHLGLPDHGDALRPGHRPEAPAGRRRVGRSATGTAPQEATLPRAGHRRDQAVVGDTPPSGRRLGALLSSDDFGSSVERAAKLHPLWQALCRKRAASVRLPGQAALSVRLERRGSESAGARCLPRLLLGLSRSPA
jgi:hypothetical protein